MDSENIHQEVLKLLYRTIPEDLKTDNAVNLDFRKALRDDIMFLKLLVKRSPPSFEIDYSDLMKSLTHNETFQEDHLKPIKIHLL